MEYVNIRNLDLTFAAKLSATKDADISKGSAIGTLNGAAAITGGYLNCIGNVVAYEDFNAAGNADSLQVGCFRVKYKPNYSVVPTDAINKMIFCIAEASGVPVNRIQVMHSPDGNIYWEADGAFALYPLGVWSPVADTEYVFEIDYDFTTGATRLFIDGVQFGATDISTVSRTGNIGLLRIGDDWEVSTTGDASYKDLCVFKTVQHTADHDSDYTIGYEFPLPDSTKLPTLVKLYGYIYDCNKPVAGCQIFIRPYISAMVNPATEGSGIVHIYEWVSICETYDDGYFECEIYLQTFSHQWEIKINTDLYSFVLPDSESVDLSKISLIKN